MSQPCNPQPYNPYAGNRSKSTTTDDAERLNQLLAQASENLEKVSSENEQFKSQISALETKIKSVEDSTIDSGKVEELEQQISNLREKIKSPLQSAATDEKEAFKSLAMEAAGAWVRTKSTESLDGFIHGFAEDRMKALNVSNAADGGDAVQETLARDVMTQALEYSTIMSFVGRKAALTRKYKGLVRVTLPATKRGKEHVTSETHTPTATQQYKAVMSGAFKVEAYPAFTDEALTAPDIDIYSDLIMSMGEQIGEALSYDILYGENGESEARGILGFRTDLSFGGESWKPTRGTDSTRRSLDHYPAIASGVAGKFGASDKEAVSFLMKVTRKLPKRFRKNAVWYGSEEHMGIIEDLRDSNERPVLVPDYRGGEHPLIRGKRFIDDELMPAPDDDGKDNVLIYGDLSRAYYINDGDVDKLLVNPYRFPGQTLIEYAKEMFEIVGNSDAILIVFLGEQPTS